MDDSCDAIKARLDEAKGDLASKEQDVADCATALDRAERNGQDTGDEERALATAKVRSHGAQVVVNGYQRDYDECISLGN